ncbi:MAG: DUF2617 family protein [Phycisphaerales bacterium]|nr:MAG: DUF2617 family protein [Phycisphaerales bacterium]
MNPQTKSNSLQSYQTILYDRALHPELFPLRERRVVRHGAYEAELWLMPGGHLFRFEFGTMCASELVTDQEGNLPDSGVLSAFLCAGERDFEHRFPKAKAGYMTTVQTETLSENLYMATYEEMMDHAREAEAMSFAWHDSGPCLSVLDVQRYSREIHMQSYHLIAAGGVVLRTQSIFEHE